MTTIECLSNPKWLAAYPNEGALDYFGSRWYRQPLRRLLVRGAAGNQFRNAKTLIFYAALCFAFRENHNIDSKRELSNSEFENWQVWFKNANFLYTVNCYAQHGQWPDAGFTGAKQNYENYLEALHVGDLSVLNLKTMYESVYPESRQWGYLAQFWGGPLSYFRSVLSYKACLAGEYGEDCFDLLSSYAGWETFLEVINKSSVSKQELTLLKGVLECTNLKHSELALAKKLIFDENQVTGKENDYYKVSFGLVKNLLDNGIEDTPISTAEDITAAFTYRLLTEQPAQHVQEYWWRILISSLSFDYGVNGLYTRLGELADNDLLEYQLVEIRISDLVDEWLTAHEFQSTSLAGVCEEWCLENLNDFRSFQRLYHNLRKQEESIETIDGLLIGYIISTLDLPEDVITTEHYLELTNEYHHFTPHVFFRKKIPQNKDFTCFVRDTCFRLIDEQYDFSIERLASGQKPKFILRKEEVTGNYIYDIDQRSYKANEGIINMIDACLKLWDNAGLVESEA